ncbi:hypothetical protein EV360DRAFT_73169 [Lentinula raphanica]|nr:hypothetical protein EV360DRAFT_73169 [Lentinula raphanica]
MTPRLNLLVFIFRLWIVLIFLASASSPTTSVLAAPPSQNSASTNFVLSWPFSFFKSFSKSENKDDAKPPKKVHWDDGETRVMSPHCKNAGNVADYPKGKLDESSHHEKVKHQLLYLCQLKLIVWGNRTTTMSEAAALYSRFRAIGSIRNREEKKRSQEEFCHKHYQGIIEGLGKLRILENEIQEHRFRERVKKLRIEYIQKSVLMRQRFLDNKLIQRNGQKPTGGWLRRWTG